jgi:hypothetical protein
MRATVSPRLGMRHTGRNADCERQDGKKGTRAQVLVRAADQESRIPAALDAIMSLGAASKGNRYHHEKLVATG